MAEVLNNLAPFFWGYVWPVMYILGKILIVLVPLLMSVDSGGSDQTLADVADDKDDDSAIGNASELGGNADPSDVVVTGDAKDD